jgi:hypothetical protein
MAFTATLYVRILNLLSEVSLWFCKNMFTKLKNCSITWKLHKTAFLRLQVALRCNMIFSYGWTLLDIGVLGYLLFL